MNGTNGHVAVHAGSELLLSSAIELAGEGLRVFPCHTTASGSCSCSDPRCASSGKHPRTTNGCKDATNELDRINAWWRRWPNANVGVATGAGLLVLDVDGPAAQAALDALAIEHGELPTTRSVCTGRDGGRHLWFRVDTAAGLGNSSGRLAPSLDSRGEGGYVLAPPSQHASGRMYSWETDAAIADAPGWVVAGLSPSRPAGGHTAKGRSALADDVSRRRRLLRVGETALQRELAALAERSSEPGSGRGTALYAAAARLGQIIAAGGLNLAPTCQALEGVGQRLGLGTEECERSVDRGLAEGMTQPRELTDRPRPTRTDPSGPSDDRAPRSPNGRAMALADEPPNAWEEIPPAVLPPFPLDALPPAMAAWAEAVGEESQTPADLAALAALGVLSAVALGAAVVDCGTWQEELGLYLLVAMPSGDRKSTVLKAARAPLLTLEREWREQAAGRVRDQRSRRDVLEALQKNLVKVAGNEGADESKREHAQRDLASCVSELEEIGEPVMPRLLADDATPEALGGLLARHPRIAVLSAESALFDNISGSYNEGKPNLHLVCAAYSGEPTRIDRRGREPEQLDRPLLAFAFSVQPHVLATLVAHPIARAQGLVGRFAYALPESRLGRRLVDAPPVPTEVRDGWAATVRRVSAANPLTELTQNSSVSSVSTRELSVSTLSLSIEAARLLSKLRAEQEPRLAEGGDLRPVSDWIARQAGRVARVAGLLHLAEHPIAAPISEGTMRRALEIGDYLQAHSLAAITEPDELHRRALRAVANHEEATITQRDLQRGPLNGRGKADQAKKLAEALVAYGALRPAVPSADQHRAGGRPPSPTYEINPNVRARDWSRGAVRG